MRLDPLTIETYRRKTGLHDDPVEEALKECILGKCTCLSIGIRNAFTDDELQAGFTELKKDPELYDIFHLHYSHKVLLQDIADERGADKSVIGRKFAQARDKVVETIIAYRINALNDDAPEDAETSKHQHQTDMDRVIGELCLIMCRNRGVLPADKSRPTLDEIHAGIDELKKSTNLFSIFNLHYSRPSTMKEIAVKLGVDESTFTYHFGNARRRIAEHFVELLIRSANTGENST